MSKPTPEQIKFAAAAGALPGAFGIYLPESENLTLTTAADWLARVSERLTDIFDEYERDRKALSALRSDLAAFRRIIAPPEVAS